jgi:hypothetical protein
MDVAEIWPPLVIQSRPENIPFGGAKDSLIAVRSGSSKNRTLTIRNRRPYSLLFRWWNKVTHLIVCWSGKPHLPFSVSANFPNAIF